MRSTTLSFGLLRNVRLSGANLSSDASLAFGCCAQAVSKLGLGLISNLNDLDEEYIACECL